MSRGEREKWDAKYREGTDDPRVTGPPCALLEGLPRGPGTALDVGCGMLRHGRRLAELGYEVLAVDASREAFRAAGAVPRSIRRVVADLDEWRPPPAAFDVVVDVHYLNRDLCPHLVAALRPGGLLVAEIRIDEANAPSIVRPFRLAPGEAETLFAPLACVAREEVMEESTGIGRYLFQAERSG